MRPSHIQLLGLALVGLLAAGGAGADTLEDPGAVDEAICSVSYAGQQLAGQQGIGFTLDGVPFTGADLAGADLSGASLVCVDDTSLSCDGRCVDLGGADLTDAVFLGANLTGASWTGTDAAGARFGSAALDGAFGRATKDGTTSFAGADLAGASLLRVDFFSSNPGDGPGQYRTDFSTADLRSSVADCRYEQVVVDLGGGETETVTEISDCPNFGGATFAGADLRGATWTRGRYDHAVFVAADLDGAVFRGGDFVGADFTGVLFDQATMLDGVFIAEDPVAPDDYAEFAGAVLAGSELSGAVLSDPLDLVDVDEDGDLCNDTVIETVDLTAIAGRDLSDATFRRIQAPGIDLAGFIVTDADLTAADLRCADLSGADLSRARLGGTDLGSATLGDADPGDGVIAMQAPSAFGSCVVPAAPSGEAPDPICTHFDGAQAQRITLSGARLNGATFVGADLSAADLSGLSSGCQNLPVDPDQNQGLSNKSFCPDFTGATLDGAVFVGASMEGPDFGSAVAQLQGGAFPIGAVDFSNLASTCEAGQIPGENEGDPPVAADFCPRFQAAAFERAIFRDAVLEQAEFGCLEPEEGSTDFPACTELPGADFTGLTALRSSWIAVLLTSQDDGNDVQPTTFADADLSEATLTCQGFSYQVIDDMVDPPVVTDVVASVECNDFVGSILTPGFVAASAVLDGVDWSAQAGWVPDLTGADLHDAAFGCFEYSYQDEADQTQVIERCSSLAGAILTDADLSGATFEGTDLSGAVMLGVDLSDAVFDADTRFAADYVPDPGATGDAVKDDCTTSGTPVDLLGADIQGADFSQVIDFGGTCVVVGKSTVYSTSTQGLTAEMQDRMSLVPEPTSGLLFTAGGLMLIGLSRRRTRGAGRA